MIHANFSLIAKLDHFLEEDVMFGQDALPRGPLWQSLQNDGDSIKSLLRIRQHRNELRGFDRELRQMLIACEEVRRKVSHSRPFDMSKLTAGSEKIRQ